MKSDVIDHYDSWPDENDDPVFDPQPLKEYIDKWDGKASLDALTLDDAESILKIGASTPSAPPVARASGMTLSPT